MANLEKQIINNPLTKITNIKDDFICFLLGLASKFHDNWRKIDYLLYLLSYFVNYHISKK